MVPFGGWAMPLQYTSMRAEHQAVRERAGLFDVSHMGEFVVSGAGAAVSLDRLVTNRVADLVPGQARYTLLCDESGGIIDDALVYRRPDGSFMVVVNAATRAEDWSHFQDVIGGSCELYDATRDLALLALQGPQAETILQALASIDLGTVGYYHFLDGRLGQIDAGFSRTGYTGEDGFELFVRSDDAAAAWQMVLDAGAAAGVLPCGLGARDILRLEASMRLSGQDIDRATNPLEAGLGWAVKLDKPEFVGREALLEVQAAGPRRVFVGLEPEGRAIPRHGQAVADAGRTVGEVTSGTFSFTLQRGIAMGFVEVSSAASDNLTVLVRDAAVPARRVPLPFYKRRRTGS